MKRQKQSVTALFKILGNLSVAATLATTITLTVNIFSPHDNVDLPVEIVIHNAEIDARHVVEKARENSAHNSHAYQATSKENAPAHILDLIAMTEGTDRGDGYNETLAYGKFTGGDVLLTGMTLAEIDSLQTEMLRHPLNKWKSSAVGRYQIVRTTLRALKRSLGLADTERFTANLQDQLATELLKSRGLDAWRADRITNKEFALQLSKEWASLPNPYTGKGYYSAQRAAVDYANVASVLRRVRCREAD